MQWSLRHWTIRGPIISSPLTPLIMKAETDTLGDAVVVEMATVGMVNVVVATIATVAAPTPKPRNLILLNFIPLLSGIDFLLQSMMKFRRNAIRKANKAEQQSKSLATSQLNMLLPSLVLCTKPNQQITLMRLNLHPIHRQAILLAAKQM